MGLRGIGAKKPKTAEELGPTAWDAEGLTPYEAYCVFAESLTVTAGMLAGQKFKLQPYQLDFARELFKTDQHGNRPVRTGLLTLPRKNGKTGFCATLALAFLAGPKHFVVPRGQIILAAADRGQASLLHADVDAFSRTHPQIEGRLIYRQHKREIMDAHSESLLMAISSDAHRQLGKSGSLVLCDEVGSWKDRSLWDALSTSKGAYKNPLEVVLSTQNADNHSLMSELVRYGKGVLEGDIKDPGFYAQIFEAPEDADPWSEEVWTACNPGIAGGYRSLQDIREYAKKAKRMPTLEDTFRLYFLNQRISLTENSFLKRSEWEATERDIPLAALEGRPCYGGLDLASVRDLASFALAFPLDDGTIHTYVWNWTPEDTVLEKEETDHVPIRAWRRMGHLHTTPGASIDKAAIVRTMAELCEQFQIQNILADSWKLTDLTRLLVDEELEHIPIEGIGQGYKSMASIVDNYEAGILERKVTHEPNQVLDWACSNCIVTKDAAGNRKVDKSKSYGRIDPLVAVLLAHASAIKGQPQEAWPEGRLGVSFL